ncbi:MAG: hypothetical protein V8S87_03875 [Oscillospiraceae bacterium]
MCRVDELSGIAQPCQLRATDMNVIPSFTRMVDRIHAYDTKVFMQLHHPGNEAFPITLHGNPVIGPYSRDVQDRRRCSEGNDHRRGRGYG